MNNPLKGLPAFLYEIAEMTKPSIAWKLMEAFGGTKLYIPKNVKPDYEIVKVLGIEDATLLVSKFGGILEDVPTGAALRSKKMAIHEMVGTSREIALKLGCTERYVRLVKNPTLDENQKNLFDC